MKTKEILNGKELSMKLIKEVSYIHKKDTVLTSEEDRLFERLKKLRNRRAVMASVPAYVIFQDSTLREMCRKRPVTASDVYKRQNIYCVVIIVYHHTGFCTVWFFDIFNLRKVNGNL